MLYEVITASAIVTTIGSIITNSSHGNLLYLAFDKIENDNPYPTLPGFAVAPDGQSVYISQNSEGAYANGMINKIWHADISEYREGARAPFVPNTPNPCVYDYSGPNAPDKGNCDITATHINVNPVAPSTISNRAFRKFHSLQISPDGVHLFYISETGASQKVICRRVCV